MNEDFSKVAVKQGSSTKMVDAKDVIVGDETLEEIKEKMNVLQNAYNQMVEIIENKYVISKDDEHAFAIGNKVVQGKITDIEKPKKRPMIYKVENGKIKVDKKKVAILND